MEAGPVLGLRADIAGFRTEISDALLYFQPGSGGLRGRPITNIYNFDGTSKFEGIEAGFGLDVARGASTLRYAKVDLENLPPDPQFIARAGAPRGDQLTWDTRLDVSETLSFGYVLRYVSDLKSVPPGQIVYIPRPGYTQHDIQLTWQPPFLRGLAVDTSVTNLSDERYVAHPTLTQDGFATEEAGRDIRVALSYRF
ncbi:TonB-dependent receptor domain-containing protein [Hyphomonas sp.]|uniref:TonB-dependent receptor domain-containing protein n=1 Tax=Hyphomonas sp. TaxID=87 RepID=UPI003919DBAC